MENPAFRTLLLPFQTDAVPRSGKALFLNACAPVPGRSDIHYQQYDRAQYGLLPAAQTQAEIPQQAEEFDIVLCLCTKNHTETLFLLAAGLSALKEGGFFICAGANDAGGRRLRQDLETAGLDVEETSKHKARVVWAQKSPALRTDITGLWRIRGAMQPVLNGAFVSCPGLFGWDMIDEGSALLMESIPGDLHGQGADFGCGFGALARFVMEHRPEIKKLACIDSDARAVAACKSNLLRHEDRVTCLWEDIQASGKLPRNLDFILMNPPFHEGRRESAALGRAFIEKAALSLRPGGSLWMVANAHLPYEKTVQEHFSSFRIIAQQKGYKIFHATK